jgi:hypothetical protein
MGRDSDRPLLTQANCSFVAWRGNMGMRTPDAQGAVCDAA